MSIIKHLINAEINKSPIRLVDGPQGDRVMPLKEALQIAEDNGVDIVMMSDAGEVPICKMMDYQKYLYTQKKAKKPQKNPVMKEIKFGYQIADHDLKIRATNAQHILEEGDKVRVMVVYRGRQMSQIEGGKAILNRFMTYMPEWVAITKAPAIEGMTYSMQIEKRK